VRLQLAAVLALDRVILTRPVRSADLFAHGHASLKRTARPLRSQTGWWLAGDHVRCRDWGNFPARETGPAALAQASCHLWRCTNDRAQVPQPLRPKPLSLAGGGHVCPIPSPWPRCEMALSLAFHVSFQERKPLSRPVTPGRRNANRDWTESLRRVGDRFPDSSPAGWPALVMARAVLLCAGLATSVDCLRRGPKVSLVRSVEVARRPVIRSEPVFGGGRHARLVGAADRFRQRLIIMSLKMYSSF
jgi:hypothetical protein